MNTVHRKYGAVVGIGMVIAVVATTLAACGTVEETRLKPALAPASISAFLDQLKQAGLPVKEASIVPGSTNAASVTLQSKSGTTGAPMNGTPDDIFAYESVIRRAVVARSDGLYLQTLTVMVVKADGTALYGGRLSLTNTGAIGSEWYGTPGISDADISLAVTKSISAAPDAGVSLIGTPGVLVDFDGSRLLRVEGSVPDANSAWQGIQTIRHGVASAVSALNGANNALIGLLQIDVQTADGKLIHRTFADLELHREQTWTDVSVPEVNEGVDMGGLGIEPH